MASFLRPRRGKRATAISQNIILKKGEVFFEVPDSGVGKGLGKIKMGDGTTGYNSLPYFLEPTDVDAAGITFTEATSTNNTTLLNAIKSGASLSTIVGNTKKMLRNLNSSVTSLNTEVDGSIKNASVSGRVITFTKNNGSTFSLTTQDTNTTYSNYKGASSSSAGTAGLVPPASTSTYRNFLRGDGTWAVPSNASTAEYAKKAGQDSAGQAINTTYIKNAAVSGRTITFTKGNGSTFSIQTQDNNTTYTLSSFGITATAAELNKLDGVTATNTELNYVDGVTSNIQTQLNNRKLYKYAMVGQTSNNGDTKPYYKFASCTETHRHMDPSVTFKVYRGFYDNSTCLGILTCHFRTNSDAVFDFGEFVWEYAGVGIEPDNFIMAYNSANPTVVELWTKIVDAYTVYHFEVIQEGTRYETRNDKWTVYTTYTNGSQASITRGYTQIKSILATIQNPISGNAATATKATKLATARTISLSGDASGSTTFDGSKNITLSVTVKDDSHNHTIANIDNLQSTLNGKLSTTGTAAAATKLATARTISLSGDASGSTTFDGSKNITLSVTVKDDSHNHTIANIDNLQSTLDGKLSTSGTAAKATKLATARTISLTGDVTGSTTFDGSANKSINCTVANNSHTHTAGNITSGTLATGVKATNSTDYTTSRLRNIRFGTSVPSSLSNGEVFFVYE